MTDDCRPMTPQHRPDGREQEDMTMDLTNFTSTDDVSDAAINAVRNLIGGGALSESYNPEEVRKDCAEYALTDRSIILAARLIQHHRPDLLVDPVDAIVREELAKAYERVGLPARARDIRDGEYDSSESFTAAKRLYLMGIEKGKGA